MALGGSDWALIPSMGSFPDRRLKLLVDDCRDLGNRGQFERQATGYLSLKDMLVPGCSWSLCFL